MDTTTAPQQTEITFAALHPAQMDDEQYERLMQAVLAGLQAAARARGLSVPENGAEADIRRVSVSDIEVMDGPDGPVETQTSVYRALAVPMPTFDEPTVAAVEQEDGTWVADIPPGFPVVEVRHGLGSYDVRVFALDAERVRTGFTGFVPITLNSVEVMPLPPVAHVIIALPEDDDEAQTDRLISKLEDGASPDDALASLED